jgi:hypothetical protein
MRTTIADPGPVPPTLRRTIATVFCCLPLALAVTALSGCEALFQSNFDATLAGQPPAQVQATGTASVFGPPGSVVVVGAPGQTSGKWLQVSRASLPENRAPIAGMVGMLVAVRGPGQYSFIGTMFLPKGSGYATLSFEPAVQPQPSGLESFLHLDFTTHNQVRIDDNDATAFGSFTRDQPFKVVVDLNTAGSPPTAHIALFGTGASGSKDYAIRAPAQIVNQFGAIRVWMGYPWIGHFDATGLLVTHATH